MLREVLFAQLVQDFRKPAVVARFIEKMRRAESQRRILVFGQIIVRQDDDAGFQLRRRQGAHDAESRSLFQMQVENHHIDRIALHRSDRRRFGVRRADEFDIRNLPDRLGQPFQEDLRVFHE